MSVHTRMRRIRQRIKEPAKVRSKAKPKERAISWREAFKDEIEKYSEGGLMLRGSRYKEGVTQKQLAEALDVRQHHISEMENGKRPIGKEIARRLANFFDVDYRIFL
jgi:DNA-binding XRE family transcriptional regulator